jgi:hypothetical protein
MNGERPGLMGCRFVTIATCLTFFGGCDESEPVEVPVARASPVATAVDEPPVLTADELRRRLGTDERARFRRVGTEIVEAHLAGAGVQSIEALQGLPLRVLDLGFCHNIQDISVLAGMPLTTLILEGTSVADLTPLKGMSLEVLHLQDTPVTDLSVIHGMPLRQLNLKGVSISDITPFAQMPLSTLWLLETDVTDISPLTGMSLESLDVQDTRVSDLSALAHMTTLRRLNIAGTRVTDLRPVTGLKLERIFLPPKQITHGLDELREIPSLGKIGTSHEHQFTAADFWERYDSGAWRPDDEQPDELSTQEPSDESAAASPDEGTAAKDDKPDSVEIPEPTDSERPDVTP